MHVVGGMICVSVCVWGGGAFLVKHTTYDVKHTTHNEKHWCYILLRRQSRPSSTPSPHPHPPLIHTLPSSTPTPHPPPPTHLLIQVQAAVGCVGAIIMPYNLFLGSAIVLTRPKRVQAAIDKVPRKTVVQYVWVETALVLLISLMVNMMVWRRGGGMCGCCVCVCV